MDKFILDCHETLKFWLRDEENMNLLIELGKAVDNYEPNFLRSQTQDYMEAKEEESTTHGATRPAV